MSARILIVEDEPGVVLTLTDRLEAEGFSVSSESDGEKGLERALAEPFDLLLLDITLPGRNGLDICRKLRSTGNGVPVLMLTARAQVVDKVVGLQIGADDYLTKPFDMMELLARVEALLRRSPKRDQPVERFEFGRVRIDFRAGEVIRDGKPVELSAREFQLLRFLVEHRGKILSRDQLLREVWGYQALPLTRTVDVHMAWLRQKLEPNAKQPQYFLTLRGLGYKFTG
ncbi:MAG: response regulator transcription factor [Bryobacteraceae bacterium]|nr:response regulator transcription factor [Bryobacteraceae bacterium]